MDNKILKDEEIFKVSGEAADQYKGDWRTVMKCTTCSNVIEWLGDYRNMGPYKCSRCHYDTLWGTNIYYQD